MWHWLQQVIPTRWPAYMRIFLHNKPTQSLNWHQCSVWQDVTVDTLSVSISLTSCHQQHDKQTSATITVSLTYDISAEYDRTLQLTHYQCQFHWRMTSTQRMTGRYSWHTISVSFTDVWRQRSVWQDVTVDTLSVSVSLTYDVSAAYDRTLQLTHYQCQFHWRMTSAQRMTGRYSWHTISVNFTDVWHQCSVWQDVTVDTLSVSVSLTYDISAEYDRTLQLTHYQCQFHWRMTSMQRMTGRYSWHTISVSFTDVWHQRSVWQDVTVDTLSVSISLTYDINAACDRTLQLTHYQCQFHWRMTSMQRMTGRYSWHTISVNFTDVLSQTTWQTDQCYDNSNQHNSCMLTYF